jgi:hypothetical protein
MKSLWTLPKPWTLKNAPTASCKTHSARFAQRPQGPRLFLLGTKNNRGHFYFAKNGDISISP